MMRKWFGASLLVLVLALAGCSEEKAKPEAKEETEKRANEDQNTKDDLAGQQAEVIKNMEKNAVQLDPSALESDPSAYNEKIIKATGTVTAHEEKGMGSSFEMKVGATTFKVMNFTMDSSFKEGSEITVYGNVKNGKDAKSGLPLINATYIN
ncbi:hypothetical protein QUF49_01830 [Fictibacillus sp. b24]|uniref:hypothetical protein n=1 Tax=unclassified Fictibacillus TaxID=2644029 RepID=UPI0025A1597B|nr:hypothetical protein [Fictibacillus sp. b24]MDM5314711.1 hypothetical protein [Fictibacillus sp. b24]